MRLGGHDTISWLHEMTSHEFQAFVKAGIDAGLTFNEWVSFMDAYCARMYTKY